MGRIENIVKRKMLTARMPEELIRDLNAIARFNNTDRTRELERYLREGIEKSKRVMKLKYVSYAIMIMTLASVSLYVWMIFNI